MHKVMHKESPGIILQLFIITWQPLAFFIQTGIENICLSFVMDIILPGALQSASRDQTRPSLHSG